MDPRSVARRLIGLAAESKPPDIIVETQRCTQVEVQVFLNEVGVEDRLVRPASQLLAELEEALADAGWNEVRTFEKSDNQTWTFGTAITLRRRHRTIFGGFLDPVRNIPILKSVPDLVARYLISVDDGADYLDREHHGGVGWHYHYLDRAKRRSNVILCWDTRWKPTNPQLNPLEIRGLFVEKHAEGGKPFKAKPAAWGPRKRLSMYIECEADLLSRNITEYRCAANKSAPVYPPCALLTPRLPSGPAAITKAASTGSVRGRPTL